MTREELSSRQAGKIYDALTPTLGFLVRLEARLTELGFQATDRYLEEVREARQAFSKLAADTYVLINDTDTGSGRRR